MVGRKLFCSYPFREVCTFWIPLVPFKKASTSLPNFPFSFNQCPIHLLRPVCGMLTRLWSSRNVIFSGPNCVSSALIRRSVRCYISAARVSAAPVVPEIREGLLRLKVSRFTEVQRRCLIPLLQGCSLGVVAQPGAGKTLAYLVPVMQRIVVERMTNFQAKDEDVVNSPFAVVLVPSRELARQVASVATVLVPQVPVLLLDPSTPIQKQQEQLLHSRIELIVTTPDRFNLLLRFVGQKRSHHLLNSSNFRGKGFNLKKLRVLVVDEADMLLQKGYMSKIKAIVDDNQGSKHDLSASEPSPKSGTTSTTCFDSGKQHLQLLFFCAVMPPELRRDLLESWYRVQILDLQPKHLEASSKKQVNEQASKDIGCIPSQLPGYTAGSAVVGAGIKTHICYINASPVNASVQSVKQCDVRCIPPVALQQELERKLLALVGVLREHAAPRIFISGVSKKIEHPPESNDITLEMGRCTTTGENIGTQEGTEAADCAVGGEFSESHQCIVFADTQDEVEYIATHPVMDSWKVSFLYSNMEPSERMNQIQTFLEGKTSVLVSTDVCARGLDIPSVTLVVHMHPPIQPTTYIHRCGRAGRGSTPGVSVTLCGSLEKQRLHDLEKNLRLQFDIKSLPFLGDSRETAVRNIASDLLQAPAQFYGPFVKRAERLYDRVGISSLVTALVKLAGGCFSPSGNVQVSTSILTGRRGFEPLLLFDPKQCRIESNNAARQYVHRLLPSGVSPEAVGRIARSKLGFLVDVASVHVEYILKRAKTVGHNDICRLESSIAENGEGDPEGASWVPVYTLDKIPRLYTQGTDKQAFGRKLPWSKMKLAATVGRGAHRYSFEAKRKVVDASSSVQNAQIAAMLTCTQ